MALDRLADDLVEGDDAHLEPGSIETAQVGERPALGEVAEGRVAAGVDLLHDVAGAVGDLAGVSAEEHVDVALDRGEGGLDLVRGLSDVAGLLGRSLLHHLGQLGDPLLTGAQSLLQAYDGLPVRCDEARDEARTGGVEHAAVPIPGRMERGADVRIAGGVDDQVDLSVGSDLVEAAVGAAADAVLTCRRDPWSVRVAVDDVPDLGFGDLRQRLEDRSAPFTGAHQRDDLGSASHRVLWVDRHLGHSESLVHHHSYDIWSEEPDTRMEVGREAGLCRRR